MRMAAYYTYTLLLLTVVIFLHSVEGQCDPCEVCPSGRCLFGNNPICWSRNSGCISNCEACDDCEAPLLCCEKKVRRYCIAPTPAPPPGPKPGGNNDPHFTTYDGHHYKLDDSMYDLEETVFNYTVPCNESFLHSRMPFKVLGKHMKLNHKKQSGVEYIILQLFDYKDGNLYMVWLSSLFHAWKQLDLTAKTAVDSKETLLYKHNMESSTQLISQVPIKFGKKFKLHFKQVFEENLIKVTLWIDDSCPVTLMMVFQENWYQKDRGVDIKNFVADGRHGMHKFVLDVQSCYLCQTCGLLGSHLCNSTSDSIRNATAQGV